MDSGRSLLLNGVPPLRGLTLFRLRGRKHGQEFRRGFKKKKNRISCDKLHIDESGESGELLLIFPIMDSGEVASLLLRVQSSCQSEHIQNEPHESRMLKIPHVHAGEMETEH